MVKANIPVKYWYHLFRDAFITPTDLDGMVVLEIEGKRATRYEHMFGKNPEWSGHLRTFCESGTVKIKTDTTRMSTVHVCGLCRKSQGERLPGVESADA
jgi:hypothetical protein